VALLIDIFGFLTVVLRGITLATQSLTIGGIAFIALLARPLAAELGRDGPAILRRCRVLLFWSAIAFAAAEANVVALDIGIGETIDAQSARAGFAVMAGAVAVALLCRMKLAAWRDALLVGLGIAMLAAQVTTSHAAARIDGRIPLGIADFIHMLAAGIWIGGIPYFLVALNGVGNGKAWRRVGKRFSLISMVAVAMLFCAGLFMAIPYIGSLAALYGTAYGVMVSTKFVLLLVLLALGGMNFLLVERLRRDPATPILRLKRFAEVEIGIGLTVLFAAASLTSVPPGADLTYDRASLHEIVERLEPQWPRLESPDRASLGIFELNQQIAQDEAARRPAPEAFVPGTGILPPRNAMDIAWSEYNHHWSGIFVLLIGIIALIERGFHVKWARNWPLIFLLLGVFLLLRSDPEVWPLGDVGLIASLRDPEVVQHRIFVILVAAFAVFEWRVRTGREKRPGPKLVFPLLTAVGGLLLLTHSHALANFKDQLLIEYSHVPLALAAMTAGWARWLELRLPGRISRVAAWVWPIAFVVIGLLLLSYREA
jgi:putative copper resistance protein D